MGATFSRIKTWIAGETLTASDLNAEYDNILNNLDPDGIDDASANNTAMQATRNPYPGDTISLATDLREEFQGLRFLAKQITGETQWYIDPDTDLATAFAHYSDTTTHGTTGDIVGTTDTQTLSAKTLTTPTIGSFVNATHNHADAAGGGFLGLDLQTPTDTSGDDTTEFDYTGISSSVRRITIMFEGVSTSSTSATIIQLGDSGGFETSGYLGSAGIGTTFGVHNTGFALAPGDVTDGELVHGSLTLTLMDSSNNIWTIAGVLARSDGATVKVVAGSKALSGVLTQLKLTTVGGTDVFDAGSFNIMLE